MNPLTPSGPEAATVTGSEVNFDRVFVFMFFHGLYLCVKGFPGLVELICGEVEGHCVFVAGDVDIVLQDVEFVEDSLFRGFDL